jgi:hypothetical protein
VNGGALTVPQASTKRKALRDQPFSAGDCIGVRVCGLGSRHRRKSKALRRLTLGLVCLWRVGIARNLAARARFSALKASDGERHSRKTIPFSSAARGAGCAAQTGRTISRIGTIGNVAKLRQ